MEYKPLFSENTITVSEINASIKACFDSFLFKSLEIFGEVSGFKMSGAHAYFTLKDEFSQIQCVCFNAARTYRPKDGESVIVRGSVDYYVKGGRLSLQVNAVTPVGQGLLFLQFERLRARLSEEGLFADEHKKPLPEYPRNVLVVTSKTGAVIRDIVTTVRRKNPIINIVVRDVRVQGDTAARDISAVLKRVDRLGFDVVILARGGGSLEDLAPFYDEGLVRTVYAMNTPVVSAIGHETDFTLIDFVADMRAPTPTAAAEIVAYDYYDLAERVAALTGRLKTLILGLYERKAMRVRLAGEKAGNAASCYYRSKLDRVRAMSVKMGVASEALVTRSERRLENAMTALEGYNPLKLLKRGFFRIESAGRGLTSVKKLKIGDTVKAIGADGCFDASVIQIKPTEDENNG